MNKHTYAVILAGGRGERFWPLSTSRRPKQLLSLLGTEPLVALAVQRLEGLIPLERVLIITSEELAEVTRRCVPDLPRDHVIAEPFGRDTAAAVALACALIERKDPEAAFCILTADHVIGDLPQFHATLRESLALALEKDVLITIGIQPTFPSTGFGYIETDETLQTDGQVPFFRAKRFVEKPDEPMARGYVESGRYHWNSGMFAWSVPSLRKAIETHCRPLVQLMGRVRDMTEDDQLTSILHEEYRHLEKISVDYALMEKADNIATAQGTFAWDDVGSWEALANHVETDGAGNSVIGQCEQMDSSGNVVYSSGHLTACIGVRDLVVVQAEGATLICPKSRAQDVKKLVQQLRDRGRYEELL